MTELWLIRHGPTAWNQEKRIQGRSDIGLSAEGVAAVLAWRLPRRLRRAAWLTSPLKRARQTATLLHGAGYTVEPTLIEMDWGAYEGCRISDLRAEGGEAFAASEARGLDFRPPGGESPRDVVERLSVLYRRLAQWADPVVAVSHKGILRATMTLATGWDMTHDLPRDVRRADGLRLRLEPGGVAHVEPLTLGPSRRKAA
ncbi:histidine phosphatase family protein [Marinivivus vitaminiproducens]|uniref:histidine phosphatase family protein n=1 Tax=Marinivivus vitaminiproducens TaxID=3035935 RepID=UPI0027A37742|nr:histidine phosphatase family protein [Geminicoccaceae bacterium SCSIO 64248]